MKAETLEKQKGLYNRYIVAKSNGKPVDEKAEYFVLRVDQNGKDPKHIEACRKAVITYAENIKEYLPELATDLINRYGTEQLILNGVGCSLPTKEEITSKLKECDKDFNLSENLNEKQAFNYGFRICYRWLKNKIT